MLHAALGVRLASLSVDSATPVPMPNRVPSHCQTSGPGVDSPGSGGGSCALCVAYSVGRFPFTRSHGASLSWGDSRPNRSVSRALPIPPPVPRLGTPWRSGSPVASGRSWRLLRSVGSIGETDTKLHRSYELSSPRPWPCLPQPSLLKPSPIPPIAVVQRWWHSRATGCATGRPMRHGLPQWARVRAASRPVVLTLAMPRNPAS